MFISVLVVYILSYCRHSEETLFYRSLFSNNFPLVLFWYINLCEIAMLMLFQWNWYDSFNCKCVQRSSLDVELVKQRLMLSL